MKQMAVIAFSIFIGVFMTVPVISDAEAKRLGGGKSFGSKSFQNKPAKRTADAPNKAQTQNANRKAEMAKKGGMMGMLGALMIGGALGALFFGGAFENINFMDILLFAGIGFLLFKLFTRRRASQAQVATANGPPIEVPETEKDHLQARQSSETYGSAANEGAEPIVEKEPEHILETGKIPRGFDQKSFLTGAENVYRLLQKAWDDGELGDLRQFCSDEVFGEIQDQIRARADGSETDIICLKLELVNVVKSGNSTEATVVFNAELKEHDGDADQTRISHVQEVWYFVRPDNRNENNWLLDGIQQLED